MSFSNLPNEVLSKVFTYIPLLPDKDGDASLRMLHSLSLSSRRLHDLVEPTLYASFKETGEYSLLAFLRAILRSPDLARYVKTFEGRDVRRVHSDSTINFPPAHEDTHQHEANHALKGLLLESMRRTGMTEAGRFLWLDEISNGSWDAATGLALTCLPNLQELKLVVLLTGYISPEGLINADDDLGEPFGPLALRWTHRALRDAKELQSQGKVSDLAMTNLITVDLKTLDIEKSAASPSHLLPFLGLPSVMTFRAEGFRFSTYPDAAMDSVVFRASIVEFRNCRIMHTHFLPFFGLFPRLEKLYFEGGDGVDLMVTELIRSLEIIEPPLRELVLRGCQGSSPRARASLERFKRLEIVDIMAPQLVGWHASRRRPTHMARNKRPELEEVLPKSLKSLSLRRCVQTTVLEASKLVGRSEEGIGKLEKLHLDFMWDFPKEAAAKEVKLLRKKCVEVGVTFTVDWDGHWKV